MICPYCGKENPDTIEICGFCGAPLTVPSEEASAEPYSPEPKVTIIDTPPVRETPLPLPLASAPQPPRGIYGNRIWWLVGCFLLVILFLCCGAGTLGIIRYINNMASILPTTLPLSLEPLAVVSTSPPSNQGLLLNDDFSDPNSGWDRADETDYFSDYYNGAYRITVKTDMSDSWANPDSNVFKDVSIEVDTTKIGGPDDNDFGVICRYQGADQFYYAIISSDGYYGITKVTPASSDLIGATELLPSDAINQGDASNRLRFDCNGDMLTLYVNGQQVDQQTDSEYTSGNVGLIAGTYGTAGTDILFDNFSVYQP